MATSQQQDQLAQVLDRCEAGAEALTKIQELAELLLASEGHEFDDLAGTCLLLARQIHCRLLSLTGEAGDQTPPPPTTYLH